MIKYLLRRPYVHDDLGLEYVECTGLSTDTKPNEVSLNSLFLELDTKTLYYCSQSGGGESEEVVFDGNVVDGQTLSTTLSETITVVFDGTTYVCEQKTFTYNGRTFTYYGANPDTSGETPSFDFSEYPFYLHSNTGSVNVVLQETAETHSLSITSLVKTEAEWTVYGEQGSGSSGDMINVYFANSSLSTLYEDYTTQMAKDGEIVLPNYIGSGASAWSLFPYDAELSDPFYTADETFTIPDEGVICTEKPSAWSLDLTTPFILFAEYNGGLD